MQVRYLLKDLLSNFTVLFLCCFALKLYLLLEIAENVLVIGFAFA